MSKSLMKHEEDTRELASKLVLMKNQIMEDDIAKAFSRKYSAVKIGSLKSLVPVSVNINISYYVSID